MTNPILNPTALLRPSLPGVYLRAWIYDPDFDDPSYSAYTGQKIVPAVGSIVQDTDETPLWVIAIDPVTLVPTYTAIPLSTENDNVVSMLNYGNSVLRLYGDYRNAPYPVTPDSKCIFLGKSPRFYTLTRYPGTSQASIVSQYYDSTGALVSQMVPLKALDDTNTSWYMPRANVSQVIDDNEEIDVTVYNEEGVEVYSARLFAKQSAVINENILYSPTIVGMTVTGTQKLADNTFFLYEKQDFSSLGLSATLVYDDGSTYDVPIDGVKCILYGQNDFIASFAGLKQYVTVKYYRSDSEAITPGLGDVTGSMISVKVPVTVIANTLGTTAKIMTMPSYNSTLARYVVKYFMYFGDGRSAVDVSGYATITEGTLNTTSAYYGIAQSYTVSVDMMNVDPVNYATSTTFTQTVVLTLNAPTQLVRWTIRDSSTSQYIYGLDSPTRRPTIRYDATLKQYFIPSYIFGNSSAFLTSYFYNATPPFDPAVSSTPQAPTHFVVRDLTSGAQIISAPIAIADYSLPFNINGDTTGNYKSAVVIVEFQHIDGNSKSILWGSPVNVTTGTYISTN